MESTFGRARTRPVSTAGVNPSDVRRTRQAYAMLHWALVIVPTVAGLDKFFTMFASWHKYLAPSLLQVLPLDPSSFLKLVGIGEIALGLAVALRPRAGAYALATWLACIVVELISLGTYLDVVLCDLALMLGALAFARFPVPAAPRDGARESTKGAKVIRLRDRAPVR